MIYNLIKECENTVEVIFQAPISICVGGCDCDH